MIQTFILGWWRGEDTRCFNTILVDTSWICCSVSWRSLQCPRHWFFDVNLNSCHQLAVRSSKHLRLRQGSKILEQPCSTCLRASCLRLNRFVFHIPYTLAAVNFAKCDPKCCSTWFFWFLWLLPSLAIKMLPRKSIVWECSSWTFGESWDEDHCSLGHRG